MNPARRGVAVLISETTRAALADDAARRGKIYRCRGGDGGLEWVVGRRAYLAPYGVVSAFRRRGVPTSLVTETDVTNGILQSYRGVVVPDAACLPAAAAAALRDWLRGTGRSMIASGPCPGLEEALGVRRRAVLAVTAPLISDAGDGPVPILGRGGQIEHVEVVGDGKVLAVASAHRQAAGDGSTDALTVPAAVATARTLYLAPRIFEYLGGALQAHVDIEPLRALFAERGIGGLDDLVVWIGRLVERALPAVPWGVRVLPWGRHPSALVLRHDTDHSRDTTYLEYEIAERVPATYAVLPDANRRYWLTRLARHPALEAAFHYRTNVENRLVKLLRRPKGFLADRSAVSGRGLARQAAAAQRAGIPIETLHRHAPFFFYPESIAGLEALYREHPNVLGTSSVFRWTLHRYIDAPFGATVTVAHPETSVPFWMPFKPVVVVRDGHRVLAGWESTHLIEPDLALLAKLFAHAQLAPGGAYVVGYHPAHARAATFTPAGNFAWLRECVEQGRRRGWWLATCRELYARLADWERLLVEVSDDGVRIENRAERCFTDLVVAVPGGERRLGDLSPGASVTATW